MGYEEYQRSWKIKEADVDAECQSPEVVTFQGEATAVTVLCEQKPHYGIGEYKEKSHTIEALEKPYYTISMSAGPPRTIKLGWTSVNGGSWTAEDSSNDPGGA
jgi:hypothetical protein